MSEGNGIATWIWQVGGKPPPGINRIIIEGGNQRIETIMEIIGQRKLVCVFFCTLL
jgi:hypothetical protein